ncbi:hypothetical protein PUN28_004005 [Cardiocondyla obscurior]|uniref:Uncharacterized protein n=1 Tax=Cardiocondyla obscurior TaxID=286306 RepID=A0AAW2GP48_9HYME
MSGDQNFQVILNTYQTRNSKGRLRYHGLGPHEATLMVYSDDRIEKDRDGKGGMKESGMKSLLPSAYLHEVGPRESLAHSVDYVDPQVGLFPTASG